MRRADRLLQLIQILRRHRRPVRGETMAEELEISLRTLYRDIADLMAQGVPIRGEAGIGYVLDSGYDLPPLMFTGDELEAIMLGLRWVSRRGDPALNLAAIDSITKIATVLPPRLQSVLLEAGLIVPPCDVENDDKIDVAIIRDAIRKTLKVKITYSDGKEKISERIIWPIALAYFNMSKIVVSWCELRSGFRSFRTDRVMSFTAQAEKYPERRPILVKRWQQQMRNEGIDGEFDIFT